jgi:hypothetical protein
MILPDELDRLTRLCEALPPAKGNYLETDFMRNLLLTVLDFQMHGRGVENAINFYDQKPERRSIRDDAPRTVTRAVSR